MNLTRVLATTLLSITAFMGAMAQDALTDSTKNTSGDSNRNVLMNASSATQPRQISLGLPISGYAYIFEDGLPGFVRIDLIIIVRHWQTIFEDVSITGDGQSQRNLTG